MTNPIPAKIIANTMVYKEEIINELRESPMYWVKGEMTVLTVVTPGLNLVNKSLRV